MPRFTKLPSLGRPTPQPADCPKSLSLGHRTPQPAGRRRGREEGQASLEFVGTFFMWLTIVLVTLQILLAMFALAQANSAARNAARSEVITAGSGVVAGRAAVAEPLRDSGVLTRCSGSRSARGSITCRVSITVPMFGLHWIRDWVPPLVVTRQNVQPMTEVG